MYIPYLHEAVKRELTKSEGSDSSLRSCKDQFGLFPPKCFKVLAVTKSSTEPLGLVSQGSSDSKMVD